MPSSLVPSKRSERLDIAKGLLILLVVYGHSIQFLGYAGTNGYWSNPVYNVIYMFHMPLFAAYSGYFTPHRKLVIADIVARAQSLIYPMAIWSILLAVLFGLKNGDLLIIPSIALSSFSGAFWFLWAVFIAVTLFWIGQVAGRYSILFYICVAAVLVLSPDIWDVLPMTAFIFPFFLGGYYVRNLNKPFEFRQQLSIGIGALTVAVLCFLNWDETVYIYTNRADILHVPQDVLLMFVGATAATVFAAFLFLWVGKSVENFTIGNIFSKLGRSTLEIYILQTLFFAGSSAIGNEVANFIGGNDVLLVLVCFAIAVVVTLALCVLGDLLKATPKTKKFFFGTR